VNSIEDRRDQESSLIQSGVYGRRGTTWNSCSRYETKTSITFCKFQGICTRGCLNSWSLGRLYNRQRPYGAALACARRKLLRGATRVPPLDIWRLSRSTTVREQIERLQSTLELGLFGLQLRAKDVLHQFAKREQLVDRHGFPFALHDAPPQS